MVAMDKIKLIWAGIVDFLLELFIPQPLACPKCGLHFFNFFPTATAADAPFEISFFNPHNVWMGRCSKCGYVGLFFPYTETRGKGPCVQCGKETGRRDEKVGFLCGVCQAENGRREQHGFSREVFLGGAPRQ